MERIHIRIGSGGAKSGGGSRLSYLKVQSAKAYILKVYSGILLKGINGILLAGLAHYTKSPTGG